MVKSATVDSAAAGCVVGHDSIGFPTCYRGAQYCGDEILGTDSARIGTDYVRIRWGAWMTIGRFVAIGDSFTEGVGDQLADGSMRGWADLVATHLAADPARLQAGDNSNSGVLSAGADLPGLETDFRYANLAIRGKLLAEIVDDQFDAAPPMRPDLMTLAGGGNDILRPGVQIPALLRLIDQVNARALDRGIRLILFTGANPSDHLPMK